MRVVVVGAGLWGTSIAFQLARRSVGSVALVERDAPGSGDSGLSFSMVRRHYSNEATARLAMRGVEIIENWDVEIGVGDSGYVRTGYLLTADEARLLALEENVRLLTSWGLDTHVVTPKEIAALEPLLSIEGVAGGAYEPDGGFADARAMTLSWFAAAVRAGVEPFLDRTVTALRPGGVDTNRGPIEGDVVVLAAGSWGRALAATAGVELPISLGRIQVARMRQPPDRPQARLTFSEMVSNLVLRPDRAGIALVVAYQPQEPLASRDECRQEVDAGYESSIRRTLRERLPAYAGAEWLGGFAGAYDSTPDWNPILGWAPGADGLYLALGGSGHGFKLAPAIGDVVADAVSGRVPSIDISALDPRRFDRGDLLRLAYGPSARA
jgi:sarcosine oxidase subunit beta